MDSNEDGDFNAIAEKSKYVVRPVKQITSLEENLPGLFQQRNIVRWTFEEDTKVGDIKRFSIASGGYVVVQLTAKVKEGLADIDEVGTQVRKILTNKKKAEAVSISNSSFSAKASNVVLSLNCFLKQLLQ